MNKRSNHFTGNCISKKQGWGSARSAAQMKTKGRTLKDTAVSYRVGS